MVQCKHIVTSYRQWCRLLVCSSTETDCAQYRLNYCVGFPQLGFTLLPQTPATFTFRIKILI